MASIDTSASEAKRTKRRPLYVTTAEDISSYIRANDLEVGEQLPSEEELASLFGVSRPTVREALRELELGGLITRSRARGTLVADPGPIHTGLGTLESIESLAARHGWNCETIDLEITVVRLTDAQAESLEVPSGTNATSLIRTKLKDGEPVCVAASRVPLHIVPLSELRKGFGTSITEFFVDQPHLQFTNAKAWVSAVRADESKAKKLRIDPGSPLVVLNETFLDIDGNPLCENRNVFIPDSIQLEVMRTPVMNMRNAED